ncbi:hypothetical protein GJ496_008321 [Pomphorhynchus laevis]|nr:hypothetical protein GJ496_007614 [Pomphorhynchus laevis]KAI0990019.1 hypothetical protein GJ496_008321 [Pomphorhynchus laevis]
MRGYRYGEIVRQFNQVRRINRIDLLNVKPKVKEKHIYVPMPYHQALLIVGKNIRFAYDNMDPILRGTKNDRGFTLRDVKHSAIS